MSPPDALQGALHEVDALIDRICPARHTLDPTRERARPLTEVWSRSCAARQLDAAGPFAGALAAGLSELAAAAASSFPNNLFWDFDLLAAELLRETITDEAGGPARLRALAAQIARLHRLYGRDTAIRFQYAHDFAYGYDWAKWIRRDPKTRQQHGPYAGVFLDHMERRGGELLALIADDDATYPTLSGDRPRNPFPFSREPEAELALHHALAAHHELPVEAWSAEARPDWRRDYAELRRARALSLGLPKK